MPPVIVIIGATAAIVASVTTGIVALIATIIAAVATIAHAIWGKNAALTALLAGLTILSLTGALKFLIDGLISLAVEIWQGIVKVTKEVYALVKKAWAAVSNFISTILTAIKTYAVKALEWIKHIVSKFKEFYAQLKASVIGKILKAVKAIADFIASVHAIALSYQAFAEGKVLKGLYILAMNFDEKLAKEIKDVYATLETTVSGVMREVSSVFDMFSKDLAGLSTYAGYLEKVLGDIAKGFGIKELEKIVEGIQYFREDVLQRARGEIVELKTGLLDALSDLIHPVIEQLRVFRLTEREYRQYQRIFSFLALDSARSQFGKYEKAKFVIRPRR